MTVDGRSRPRSRWSRPSSTSRHNGDRPAAGLTNRTASDPTQLCPALADAPTTASARISFTTRSSSWYGSPTDDERDRPQPRACFLAARGHRPGGGRGRSHRQRGAGRPATAVGGDHREFRFVPLEDQPDTADLGVTLVDAWQGRGIGSALLARLSERAVEVGVEYFTAEVLAKNRSMLTLLATLGRVETESAGPWSPPASRSPNRPGRPGSHRAVAGERRVGFQNSATSVGLGFYAAPLVTCPAVRNREPVCQEPSEHAPWTRPAAIQHALGYRKVHIRHIAHLSRPRTPEVVLPGQIRALPARITNRVGRLRRTRVRLTCVAWRASVPLPAMVQAPSAMMV